MHRNSFVALALLGLTAAAPSKNRQSKRDTTAVVSGAAAVCTINDNDGVGAGSTTYVNYAGDGSTGAGWPAQSSWASFSDMFTANIPYMQESCGNNGWGDNDSDTEVQGIQTAIEAIAQQGCVDHRFILAIIMQESEGCVRVPTTDNGVSNPGLMQDHDGSWSCSGVTPCPQANIQGMISDGAIGTASGDGLATLLNTAEASGTTDSQTFYWAARLYNSGSVCDDDLSNACGATASYASDVANRLTGWVG